MAQHFMINGKEYLSSAEVARRFGYTSDYVSRLAREQKIVASNVNRKWFIDIDSFTQFQQSTTDEKEQRARKLKEIRQKERQLHLQHKANQKRQEHEHIYIAMAQSFAMFVCFAFVGLLGWIVVDSDISMSDVSFGVGQTYQQVIEVAFSGAGGFDDVASWSTALVLGSITPQATLVSEHQEVPVSQSVTSVTDIGTTLFSDEVELLSQEDGVRVVRPVFSNERVGQAYQITPVVTQEDGNLPNE